MKLIADSGSTKTDWRILAPSGEILQAKTMGFNPYYQASEEISREVREKLLPQLKAEVSEIHFYGAGCSNSTQKKKVAKALQEVFPQAHIQVEHDLLAAARALCGHEAGIACILGTGSNSCFYDGENIVQNIASLGFMLGDEGSGAALGRELIKAYMRNQLPEVIKERFEKRFPERADEIMERIYQQSFPNRYLAQFSQFLYQNLKEPYVYRLVYSELERFFEATVMKYERFDQQKVHFTGSIAFYYGNLLRQIAQEKGVMVRNIIESPIAGLTLYHQQKI
jgi:glucosamine kinase